MDRGQTAALLIANPLLHSYIYYAVYTSAFKIFVKYISDILLFKLCNKLCKVILAQKNLIGKQIIGRTDLKTEGNDTKYHPNGYCFLKDSNYVI